MKIKINKQNIERFINKKPIKLMKENPIMTLGALALATVIATTSIGKINSYVNRPNAIGSYVTISDYQRKQKINEWESKENKFNYNSLIEDKYIYKYKDIERIDEILQNTENDKFSITYELFDFHNKKNKDLKTIHLKVTQNDSCVKDEDYKELNDQLLTIFSKLNIESLKFYHVDLAKIDHNVLKKIKIKELNLFSCDNDFDYKYFDTSNILQLWIYGKDGDNETKEHYDLKEYSYTKSLLLCSNASYKNLDKMFSLEDFTLFNTGCDELKREDYNNMIEDLKNIYRYRLIPFSSIYIRYCPENNIVLPPAESISIDDVPDCEICNVNVDTNILRIDNMYGVPSTNISISGKVGKQIYIENATLSELNIYNNNKYGDDLTYNLYNCQVNMSLEDINEKIKDCDLVNAYVRYEDIDTGMKYRGDLIKADNKIRVVVDDSKIMIKTKD